MSNKFLTNYSEQSFLDVIKDRLRHCSSFDFSVSFIKKAGLVLLLKDIEAAVARGAKGRIITSTYQNFTDIESLKSFFNIQSRYSNFECHLDYECFHDSGYNSLGYHSKGYLFTYDEHVEVIVGSSNITRFALLKNIEWDLDIAEDLGSPVFAEAKAEFESMWQGTHLLNQEIISLYSDKLNFAIERWDMDYDLQAAARKPNFMQRKALKELNRYRAVGTQRALVVAAAGSGKTYLAAFDAMNFNPKRLLYVVHEGSILRKSLETFQDVFGGSVSYGIYSGESKEFDADFVFSTNITMSNNLDLFSPEEFDYIIVDECHHATADTYKRIMEYFKPEFLLGLTATPERMDNEDVFDLFDKNVPYELRLRDAIVNGLVVPFKYYGIRDTLIDYGLTASEERRLVAQLATVEHCDFICNEIEARRPEGKLKAIAFCRSITHARMMAEQMGERYNTAYLTGRNTVGERIKAYNDLQNDSSPLEILFCVDILNEGVDIPGINMVLFLRPTESSTVFIQQLGRGLRKYDNKPFVTVLDFIGNSYKRSVQIAFALSSLAENFVVEKQLMMSLVEDDFKAVGLEKYGVEIHIDSLSKEEIRTFLESENFNAIKYLKQDYFNFKKYVNSELAPRHMDFLNNDCAPDIIRFMSIKIGGKKTGSYYNFLKGIDEQELPAFEERQLDFASYLSNMLPLVRPHEYFIFQSLINGEDNKEEIRNRLCSEVAGYSDTQYEHALRFIEENGFAEVVSNAIKLKVELDTDFVDYVEDLINYGLTRYNAEYGDSTGFKLWKSYRMDQVQLKRCINPGYTAVGTYYDDAGNVFIFASIHKDEGTKAHLLYKDMFLEPNVFQWESMANLPQKDAIRLKNSQRAYLFIRKMESEHGITLPFTYVGTGKLTNPRDTDKKALLFTIIMDEELPDYLQYDFGLLE